MRRATHIVKLGALIAVSAAAISCGDVIRQGRSPVILVVQAVEGARGSSPDKFTANALISSVLDSITSPPPCTPAAPCQTVFNDPGRVVLNAAMKDATVTPTTNNQVTIRRYHVEYTRTDGRNTPGVDVPFPFDGATTLTVPAGGTGTVIFDWVRHAAKAETPLVQLVNNSNIINVIGTVTLYGSDTVGNDISVSGQITITFGRFLQSS